MTENREAWLQRASKAMDKWLGEVEGVEVVPVHVTVGWPSSGGLGTKARTLAECWARKHSADGVNQIFMTPMLGEESTVQVLGNLLHEKVHAVDDCESGHRKEFIRISKALGFVAKWTSLNMSPELEERLKGLAERLGPIPSPAISVGNFEAGGEEEEPKDKNRQLKVECANDTGYKVRMTRKWLDEFGAPICPCCNERMIEPEEAE